MANVFKALSALLTYPTEELKAEAGGIRDAIDRVPEVAARQLLHELIDEIARGDLYDLQERYVLLFDRTRSLSLHLFEHVHGESRDRGQAMIDLATLYREHGLSIGTTELPDYLPLFLEFLSTLPLAEACGLLEQPGHIISAIGDRLRKRESAYAAVFDALVGLSTLKPREADVQALLREDDSDPGDLAALDVTWEDAPVTFGPDAAPGCRDGLIARLRAAKRPAARAN
jgi:nitrate reductase delta subunit